MYALNYSYDFLYFFYEKVQLNICFFVASNTLSYSFINFQRDVPFREEIQTRMLQNLKI